MLKLSHTLCHTNNTIPLGRSMRISHTFFHTECKTSSSYYNFLAESWSSCDTVVWINVVEIRRYTNITSETRIGLCVLVLERSTAEEKKNGQSWWGGEGRRRATRKNSRGKRGKSIISGPIRAVGELESIECVRTIQRQLVSESRRHVNALSSHFGLEKLLCDNDDDRILFLLLDESCVGVVEHESCDERENWKCKYFLKVRLRLEM